MKYVKNEQVYEQQPRKIEYRERQKIYMMKNHSEASRMRKLKTKKNILRRRGRKDEALMAGKPK